MIHLVFFIPLCVFEFVDSYKDTEMEGWDIIIVPFPVQHRDDFVRGIVDVLGLVGAEENLYDPVVWRAHMPFWDIYL